MPGGKAEMMGWLMVYHPGILRQISTLGGWDKLSADSVCLQGEAEAPYAEIVVIGLAVLALDCRRSLVDRCWPIVG
jgi:hypothetical protein